jgi:dethiobiotin synthetase
VRGVFVTGTDTGVGKTVVAAAICAALAARGERVAAFKPVVTGTDDEPGDWPPDHELLAAAANAGQTAADVAPHTFGPPLSPHYAAELASTPVDPAQLRAAAATAAALAGADAPSTAARSAAAGGGPRSDSQADGTSSGRRVPPPAALICEGVGGLLVPLTPDYSVRDLAADLALPLLIVARTGLGTINHTLLAVEAARTAGLHVAGIVMTPWPEHPEPIERSNRATVERLSGIAVSALPPATPTTLATAGAALPLDDWL